MNQHEPTPSAQPSSSTVPIQVNKSLQIQDEGNATLFSQLTANPFFTAGFGLAALATGLRLGQQGLKQGAYLLKRRLLVDVEVTRNDEAYGWLLHWMSAHQRAQMTGIHVAPGTAAEEKGIIASLIKRFTPGLHHLQIQTAKVNRPDGSAHTSFSLVPGPGRHVLRYRNAFIAVNRQREKSFDLATGVPFETVTLTTLYSHRRIFEELFTEAHQYAQRLQEGKTVIYTAWGMDWKPFGDAKRKRNLESVILEEGVKERILNDVETFIEGRTWYLDRGIPYRRGYLLYGPPGTGKSSFIQALAGHIDYNIAMLNVSERGLTDDKLNHLLTKVPPRTIVLLEDADAAFTNRRRNDSEGYAGSTVTFSGLLNALDGVASAEERIIFLTTNHVDRLDKALVRPGRVDMTVRLGEATAYQMEGLWDRFYQEFDGDGVMKRRFMRRVEELGIVGKVSTAALQGLFLYNKEDMERAIVMVEELVGDSGQGNESGETMRGKS